MSVQITWGNGNNTSFPEGTTVLQESGVPLLTVKGEDGAVLGFINPQHVATIKITT